MPASGDKKVMSTGDELMVMINGDKK